MLRKCWFCILVANFVEALVKKCPIRQRLRQRLPTKFSAPLTFATAFSQEQLLPATPGLNRLEACRPIAQIGKSKLPASPPGMVLWSQFHEHILIFDQPYRFNRHRSLANSTSRGKVSVAAGGNPRFHADGVNALTHIDR